MKICYVIMSIFPVASEEHMFQIRAWVGFLRVFLLTSAPDRAAGPRSAIGRAPDS